MAMVLGGVLTGMLMAGCAGGSGSGSDSGGGGGDSITISKGVWAKFQDYKNQLKPGDDQYFAASSTGGFSWNADKDKAVAECQKYSNGGACIVFAHNDQILVPYHVR
jgi:hypothetical protein